MKFKKIVSLFPPVVILALDFVSELEPVEAGFKALSNHRTTCTYKALREFTQLCQEFGADNIDANLRLRLAVKLSICEFIEAGVDYPEECKIINPESDDVGNETTFRACVANLRSVPQFWTTYSGNFRKLRLLCFEELAPFVKDNILDLYLNITRLYSTFYSSASRSAQSMARGQEETLENLGALKETINDLVKQMFQFKEAFTSHQEMNMEAVVAGQDVVLSQFHSMSSMLTNNILGSIKNTETLQNQMQNLFSEFEILSQSLNLGQKLAKLAIDTFHQMEVLQAGFVDKIRGVDSEMGKVSLKAQSVSLTHSNLLTDVDRLMETIHNLHNMTILVGELQSGARDASLLLKDELHFQTKNLAKSLISVVLPYLLNISVIGSDLEKKLRGISNSTSIISSELKSLEKRISLIPSFLFSALRGVFGPLILTIKTILLSSFAYICVHFLSKLHTQKPKRKRKKGFIMSFLTALILGFLVALPIRIVFSHTW